MSFATEEHVAEMREMLLKYGASESVSDQDRWELRQRADKCERIRLQNERDIIESKAFSPVAATLELNA